MVPRTTYDVVQYDTDKEVLVAVHHFAFTIMDCPMPVAFAIERDTVWKHVNKEQFYDFSEPAEEIPSTLAAVVTSRNRSDFIEWLIARGDERSAHEVELLFTDRRLWPWQWFQKRSILRRLELYSHSVLYA